MKKIFYLIFSTLFFIFVGTYTVSASEGGVCIINQKNYSYNIETPFYWYEVTKEELFDNMLNSTTFYTHTVNQIKTKEHCESLNNISPTYKQGINNNALSNRTITYYFSKDLLDNSQTIYTNSLKKFAIPDIVYTTGFEITSTYITFDNLPPVIASDKIDSTIIANVGIPFSVTSLKDKITAYDEVDGIVEVNIKEDTYSANYNTLGTYKVIFSATDNSGNNATLTLNIKVIDSIKPNIIGSTSINNYMSNPLTIEQIKSTLTVEDNYDTNLNNTITVESDNYSSNISKEGKFQISFIAKDNSNNVSPKFTITITNIDDIAPIINGELSYSTSIKNLIDISTILNQLTVTDNVDTNPLIELKEDTYTSNYHKVGLYHISFVAKDKNNNISPTFIVNIITEDLDKPIFYISKKFIGVDINAKIPIDEIINLVNEANNIDTQTIKSIIILEDNYSQNTTTPGTYSLKLKYTHTDNSQTLLESSITILDSNIQEKEENKSTHNNFWSALKTLLIKLWNFIKRIFLFFKELI